MNEQFNNFEKELLDELKRCCEQHYKKEDMVDFYSGCIYELKEMLVRFYKCFGRKENE